MKRLLPYLGSFSKFSVIGGLVFAIGLAIQWALVEFANMSATVAFAIQLVVTIWLNYELNRRVTWRSRQQASKQMVQFFLSRFATGAVAWVLNWALLQIPNVHYLLAGFTATSAIMVMNFAIGEKLIFKPSEAMLPKTERTPLFKLSYPIATLVVVGLVMLFVLQFTLTLSTVLFTFASIGVVVSIFEYYLRTYTSRTPEAREGIGFPLHNDSAEYYKFTLIVPAYHEEDVLEHTLELLANLDYPKDMYEVFVTLRHDDHGTIALAAKMHMKYPDIIKEPVVAEYTPRQTKPSQMNTVLPLASGDFVSPIDAEDRVARNLLKAVNAKIHASGADVVQGGVQLMNLENKTDGSWLDQLAHYCISGWFAVHNVLEYLFWFSSRMFYQAWLGFVPLGGNTVFTKLTLLRMVGGWDEDCLTEDAALGVKLSVEYNVKIVVAYEPELVTREHTPPRIFGSGSLFKQRVRWDQGFWQVLRMGQWRKMPTLRQRVMGLYVLATPLLQAINGLMLPVAIMAIFFLKVPLIVAMVLFLPFIPMLLTMMLQMHELRDFGKKYEVKIKLRHYVSLVLGFMPYQFILSLAAIVGVLRELFGIRTWSKTARSANLHKQHTASIIVQPEGGLA